MGSGIRYPDNEFLAGVAIAKEASSDTFGGKNAQSDGWEALRFAEVGLVDPDGARLISRDKEYSFRPKLAKLAHEQVNYRHFANPEGGDSGSGSEGTSFDPGREGVLEGGYRGSLTFGLGGEGEGGQDAGKWDVDSNEVGFEISNVSDYEGELRSKPDYRPASMNSPNRSGLVISRRLLEDEDDAFDLPPRYFSRVVDLYVPQATQGASRTEKKGLKFMRTRYKGGGSGADVGLDFAQIAQDDALLSSFAEEQASGGETARGSFFSKTASEEEYEEGIWKTTWNITPFERPYAEKLDQLTEEDGGPGDHGFACHPYIKGYPEDNPEIGDDGGDPPLESYFQGGWVYDGRQDVLAHISDILAIDAIKNEAADLPRYLNRFGQKVGIAYLRHDVHFQKVGDDD